MTRATSPTSPRRRSGCGRCSRTRCPLRRHRSSRGFATATSTYSARPLNLAAEPKAGSRRCRRALRRLPTSINGSSAFGQGHPMLAHDGGNRTGRARRLGNGVCRRLHGHELHLHSQCSRVRRHLGTLRPRRWLASRLAVHRTLRRRGQGPSPRPCHRGDPPVPYASGRSAPVEGTTRRTSTAARSAGSKWRGAGACGSPRHEACLTLTRLARKSRFQSVAASVYDVRMTYSARDRGRCGPRCALPD